MAATRKAHDPITPGEIVRAITTDSALRLSKAPGADDRFWINIQTDYDLEVERDRHGDDLARVTVLVAS